MGFWEESVAFLGVEVWSSAERCVCSAVGFVDALGCRHSSWLVASDAQETKTSGCGGPAVLLSINCCCCCSTAKLCLTLSNPMDCSTPGSSVLHYLLEFAQICVHWISDLSSHLILHHPLLLMPSIFPSIRVFSNELALHIRWPKVWRFSFSFSISPSNEYPGLISFRFDWLDLLARRSKGLSRVFSNTTVQKHQFFGTQLSLQSISHTHTWLLEKPQLLTVQIFVIKEMSLLCNMQSRLA